MDIKEVTVTAEASKAYQKYCVSLTATDLAAGDMEKLKTIVISQSLKGINEMIEAPEEPVVETRTVVENVTPAPAPQNLAPHSSYKYEFKEKLTGQMLSTGAVYRFTNDKNTDSAEYKLCYSKERNDYFWALVDQTLINNGFKKYIKSGVINE